MKIPVTRNFDTTDLIGTLTLRDDIEIAPDMVFALSYLILERAANNRPTKIAVQEVSLIPEQATERNC